MLRVLTAFMAFLISVSLAHAEKRVALVIGNSSYKLISPLANPKNDAALMAATLQDVGFEVVTAIDVDIRDMGRAVRKFGKSLRKAGKDAVGLFYYAGHGIQSQGVNYLVPLGAQIEDEADLDIEAFSASDVLRQMETAGNTLNLVLLDACRNNPMASRVRSGGRGLARIAAASGSLIAFSAAPGQVAADGRGKNSPYTAAFVETLRQPGLTVEQVFKRVRVKVESQTNGRQTPWEESSLRGDFYFVPKKASPAVDEEELAWNLVKDSNGLLPVMAFRQRYPNGRFSVQAAVLLDRLEQKTAADKAAHDARLKAVVEDAADFKAKKTELAALSPSRSETAPESIPQTAEQMTALGLRYEDGSGIQQDLAKAAKWYREAANKGYAGAKYRLGLAYYHGRGVSRSWSEAAIQILDAVKLNHGPAVNALTKSDSLRDPDFVRALQQRLKTFGLYTARIDGKWGRGSRDGVLAHSGQIASHDSAKKVTPKTTKKKARKSSAGKLRVPKTVRKKKISAACKMHHPGNPEQCTGY